MPPEARMTIQEAAILWGVSYTTVRKWIAQGRVAAEKHGRDWAILQRDRPEKLQRGTLGAARFRWHRGAEKPPTAAGE